MNMQKLSEVISENTKIGANLHGTIYEIGVLSNITINQIKDPIELVLREKGINAEVELGDYDNIVQDSIRFKSKKIVIVFWELANLIEDFNYRVDSLDASSLEELVSRFESEISFVLQNLATTPLVLFNRFSTLMSSRDPLMVDNSRYIAGRLNAVLDNALHANLIVVEIDNVICGLGATVTFDWRLWQSSKLPYTYTFIREYVLAIMPALYSINGLSKKVLVVDCDNTLWGGVVGEDGPSGIDISSDTRRGKSFFEIHKRLLTLKNKGVLLAICSKNNANDVEEVFTSRPDFLLSSKDFVAQRINWERKDHNIVSLSEELNVGLDSFVFLDDSDFELGLISNSLPEVDCFQVPSNLSEYSSIFDSIERKFFKISMTQEDQERAKMYFEEASRKADKNKWTNQDEYIQSLGLKVTVSTALSIPISRASQLTQKTNQFNLTTKRYSESEIEKMVNDDNFFISSYAVADKYGDYGTTALIILERDVNSDTLIVDTFLMSCRVIGRKLEFAIFEYLMVSLVEAGFRTLKSKYIKTQKNAQVNCFFDSLGFRCLKSTDVKKDYILEIADYKASPKQLVNIMELK